MSGPAQTNALTSPRMDDGWLRFFANKTESRQTSNRSELSAFLIVAAVGILSIVPVMLYGIPENKDLSNHLRFAIPFYDAIRAGHFYPGWLAEATGGLGDPSFRFYPPGLYYLLAATRTLTGNWYSANIVTFTLISVAGGLGLYFWTRSFLPRNQAIFAAIFYTLSPYHVNQLYQAFLLAEYAASAVLPVAFGFVHRVCREGRKRDVAGLAAAYALLILTHLPLTVIGSLALVMYALLCIDWKKSLVPTFSRLSLSVLLGLAASAGFWVTMVSELKWVGFNSFLGDGSVDYRHNFIFSTFSADNLNVWWLNILTASTCLMFFPAIAYFTRGWRGDKRYVHLRAVAVMTVMSFLMMTYVSWPIWRWFHALQDVQFPWRWMSVVSMAGSVVTASFVPFWIGKFRGKSRPIAILVFGAVLISVSFTLFQLVRQAQYLTSRGLEAKIQSLPGSDGLEYWWPIWAERRVKNINTRPQSAAQVDAGSRAVTILAWESENRTFQVAGGGAADVRVETFYYPHWTATAGTKDLALKPDENGLILISLPPEATTVKLEFREPLRSRISAVASATGWCLIVLLALYPSQRRRMI